MWKFLVYEVLDSNGVCRYVGCTRLSLATRFYGHKSTKNEFGQWIRNELALGKSIKIVVVDSIETRVGLTPHAVLQAEKDRIEMRRKEVGDLLFNKTDKRKYETVSFG
jgi:hypothetical protein